MFRFLARLLFPRTTWHHESVSYHERSNRHSNSMDPNYWHEFKIDRSSAGNLKEHPAPWQPSTDREKRLAKIIGLDSLDTPVRYQGRLYRSVSEHARSLRKARPKIAGLETAGTHSTLVN